MAKGYIKHKILVKERKYNVPAKEEQWIIALLADFDDLKKKKRRLNCTVKRKTPKEQETQFRRGRGREMSLEESPTYVRRMEH